MREAIDIMREYHVSQMPVVKAEPPVMIAEVVGSVVERDLLERCSPGTPGCRHAGAAHVAAAAGGGWREPVEEAVDALEKADAAMVLVDGKPAGVLTRQDLLRHVPS